MNKKKKSPNKAYLGKKVAKKAILGEKIDPATLVKTVPDTEKLTSLYKGFEGPDYSELNAPMSVDQDELVDIHQEPGKKAGRGIPASYLGLGLQVLNSLVPDDRIKNPVTRPQMVYNDRSYGTGSQAIYEDGGILPGGGDDPKAPKKPVFTTQSQLDAANAEAMRFSTSRNLIPSYAGRKLGDPVPQYVDETGKPYVPAPTKALPRTIPSGISIDQIKTAPGMAWYEDPHTGDLVDVDPSVISQKQFRKPASDIQNDLIARTKRLKNGGKIHQKDNEIQLLSENADIIPLSTNPYSGDIMEFKGPSHSKGGIDIKFGKKEIEVEGDETTFIDGEGNLQIMGNMNIPGTTQKFKNATKDIARKEMKASKEKFLAMQMMEGLDPANSGDKLKMNSAMLNISSADTKQKQLAKKKDDLAALQAAILEEADRQKVDPNSLTKPKAKKGMKVSGDPDPDEKIAKKFQAVKDAATKKLQALYPGQKVEFLVNRERDIRGQRGLKGSGASRTSVSLHNFGGAADFTIKVDGKIIDLNTKGGLDVYKKTLHTAAKEHGMHTIGDWDPYHVSLVQEGKGTTFSSLFKQYPELKSTKRYADSVSYLKDLVDKGEADATELRTYNMLTGSTSTNKKAKSFGDYKQFILPETRKGQMVGENFFEDLPEIIQPNPGQVTTVTNTGTPVDQQKQDADANIEYQGDFNITAPNRKKIGTNVEKMRFAQILPEVVSQVTNRVDPVFMQQFTPEYLQPYNISLQDQVNENNATFNGLERMVDDPSALSVLAAQKYQANQKVLAEQFRINQGIEGDVIARNTATANDAQLKNLGLADQQYVRQETAKSKTRTLNREILNSMSAKELQHDNSMRRLAVWENMYDYRFADSNGDGIPDQADYQGPAANFDFSGPLGSNNKQKNTQTVTLDQYGVPIRTQKKVEDVVPQERINISKKGKNGASIPSLYSQMQKMR